jgi:predicted signal transduction protein with EAL and GGDEF domain
VGRRLRSYVAESDTLAWLGGDEFVVVARRINHAEDAARIAHRLRESLRQPFVISGREIFVTASIGISLYPRDGDDAETLIRNAHRAMYQAKQQGAGDTQRLYAPTMKEEDIRRLSLESALHRALDRRQLVLHYQPLVEIASGKIYAAEALVRWQHPELGLLPPAEFLSLAEASKLIVAIGSWVLETACARAKAWHEQGHRLKMSVNLTARHLRQPNLVDEIALILQLADLPGAALDIEITEGAAMQDLEGAVHTLQGLRRLGVTISMDDFGTGYSSLGYLRRLPVDTVKLDQSFVRDLTTDPGAAAISAAVIAMAHSLSLRVVAEGVETAEQLAFLKQHGCEAMQGQLFSPPLPAEEVGRLLTQNRTLAPEN